MISPRMYRGFRIPRRIVRGETQQPHPQSRRYCIAAGIVSARHGVSLLDIFNDMFLRIYADQLFKLIPRGFGEAK